MDLAFESAYYGTKKIRKMREKYDCNIPWTILVDPTSACNLHCTGCWAAEYGHQLNLSNGQLDSIITQGKKLGIYFYMFTGGEPLCRKHDILWLAKKHHDCEFNIFTNGTLVDDEFCEEVTKLGNIVFSVSLEGFRDINDGRRGKGDFDKVMRAMDIMRTHGLLFGTSICYTSVNCEEVTSDKFIDMIIEKGCRFSWFFNYMPVGAAASVALIPTVKQREYMYHRVREIRSGTGGKPIFTMDFQNDGEFVGGCIAGGRNYCHINANGDVEPCVFIHYSGANIKNVSLLEALHQPLFMAYRDNQPFNRNHLRPCPMLENPEYLERMVKETGARSTDLECFESAEALCGKCRNYADEWAPEAERLWKTEPRHHVQYYVNYKGANHGLGKNDEFKTAMRQDNNPGEMSGAGESRERPT